MIPPDESDEASASAPQEDSAAEGRAAEGKLKTPKGAETGDPSDLRFLMGKHEARIPLDRRYCRNHMWASGVDGGRLRFGFSAYAVRLLQDVYFLEWSLDPGDRVREKQPLGNIESSKAESELYSPVAGTLVAFNQALLADPTPINTDKYGLGWLFEIEPAAPPALLSPEEYLVHLAAAWEVAQRTIKKQVNE